MAKSDKIPWTRASEASLLELVREKRYLWDAGYQLYHKTKLRREGFRIISEALILENPELSSLTAGN